MAPYKSEGCKEELLWHVRRGWLWSVETGVKALIKISQALFVLGENFFFWYDVFVPRCCSLRLLFLFYQKLFRPLLLFFPGLRMRLLCCVLTLEDNPDSRKNRLWERGKFHCRVKMETSGYLWRKIFLYTFLRKCQRGRNMLEGEKFVVMISNPTFAETTRDKG